MKYMSIISLLLSLLGCSGRGVSNLDPAGFEAESAKPEVATLDVRTADEYAAGHLPWASNIDWYAPDFLAQVEAIYPKSAPLAIYCRSGRRSADAASALSKAGYTVCNLRGGYMAWCEAGKPTSAYTVETFFTPGGLPVAITLIKHGTLALRFKGLTFHVDPVGGYGKPTDYAAEFPKADVILVTHEHGDHFDRDAIAALVGSGGEALAAQCGEVPDGSAPDCEAPGGAPSCTVGGTVLVTNARCAELLAQSSAPIPCTVAVVANGDSLTLPGDVLLQAVPAYNYTEGRTQFHPKGRDNGFVLTLDGLRVYIAGDTEDIPEMASLAGAPAAAVGAFGAPASTVIASGAPASTDPPGIDVAFLPVNQPYTMTVEQCVRAAKVIGPRVLIPYHFSSTDLSELPSLLPGIDVRLRDMQ